jgi:hypothetical protein
MNKFTYTRPTLIDHGPMVDSTKGNCSCKTEDGGFKPADPELL